MAILESIYDDAIESVREFLMSGVYETFGNRSIDDVAEQAIRDELESIHAFEDWRELWEEVGEPETETSRAKSIAELIKVATYDNIMADIQVSEFDCMFEEISSECATQLYLVPDIELAPGFQEHRAILTAAEDDARSVEFPALISSINWVRSGAYRA